jgi:hypothetical protein
MIESISNLQSGTKTPRHYRTNVLLYTIVYSGVINGLDTTGDSKSVDELGNGASRGVCTPLEKHFYTFPLLLTRRRGQGMRLQPILSNTTHAPRASSLTALPTPNQPLRKTNHTHRPCLKNRVRFLGKNLSVKRKRIAGYTRKIRAMPPTIISVAIILMASPRRSVFDSSKKPGMKRASSKAYTNTKSGLELKMVEASDTGPF